MKAHGPRHFSLLFLVAALSALALSACSAPEPRATAEEIDDLERDAVFADQANHRGLVSYLRAGEARVARVIFLHAAPGDARGWADFLLDPAPGQEYIAVDRPGYGQSRPDGAVTRLDAQAAALVPLLEQRRDIPTVLVGHAQGAAVALAAASRYPDRVAGLVLLAGTVDPALQAPHWTRSLGAHAPVRWLLPRAVANANREHLARADELRRLGPRLEDLDLPVRAIHGQRDAQAPSANLDFLRASLGEGRLTVLRLRNAGHFLPWTATAVIRAQINNLVADICGGLSQCDAASTSHGDRAGAGGAS